MRRFAFLAYGFICYLCFAVTLLYAIGFVGNLVVPRSIDSGPTAPLGMALAINAGLLALFAVQHSVMARRGFKRWWTRIVPQSIERSTFVLLTCVVLGLTFWQWRALPDVVWDFTHPAAWWALTALSAAGWVLVTVATFVIDHFDLFGLRQVWLHFRGRPYTQPRFKESLIYRTVRHPLLLGFLIAFWSAPRMTLGHLFFALVVTGYIIVAIQLEERDLVAHHGPDYVEYRRRVPMLIPSWGRRRKARAGEVVAAGRQGYTERPLPANLSAIERP
jgi:protein-S-isoprenylcysteine O-methyltransferase Ste14